jgi:hypothetical protein
MRFLAVPAVSLLLSSGLIAQTTTPIDPRTILAGLQQIKQKQSAAAKQQLTQTLSDFNAARGDAASAVSFYEQAVDVTRFIGRPDAGTAFETWKKDVVPRMNPAAVQTALWYTSISVQRAAGATDDEIFPAVLAYAESVQPDLADLLAPVVPPGTPPNAPGMAGQRGERRGERDRNAPQGLGIAGDGADPGEKIMEEEVSENVFSGLDKWEMVPANIDGIYEKFLLPIMRKNRDARILDYWDNKILNARGVASSSTGSFNTDNYNQEIRPALLWSRAEDEIVIGQRPTGLTDMYNLVKSFPAHPEAAKWIAELEGLLSAPPSVAADGTSQTAPQ